ncbi:MAG: EFR1 family ferrodoxin [PVC group bacterium]
MIKDIDIYYFSGTGNTLLVVKKMADVFRENGAATRLLKIEKSDPARINTARTIGLAFPVAAQSTYPLVWEFIEQLPPAQSTGVFMVDTLAAFSGGIVGPLRKLLTGKGYRPLGAKEIVMPNNFLPGKINHEKNERKKEFGLKKAGKFAVSLLEGTASWGRVPIISDLLCKISRSRKVSNYLSRKGSRFTLSEFLPFGVNFWARSGRKRKLTS